MSNPTERDRWLDALYRDNFALIYRVAAAQLRWRTGSGADAEDVVQDVFLLAHRKLRLDHPATVGWLLKATEFVCSRYATVSEKNSRRVRRQMERILLESPDWLFDSAAPEETAGADWRLTLESSLSESDLKLFQAFYLYGYTLQEISRASGRSVGSLRVQLYRLRKRIRRLVPMVLLPVVLLRLMWRSR